MKRIRFSPVTRLSGLLSVEVCVDGCTVVDARVKGDQFRGFEWMLVGRDIRDAPYFTERICGICSFAHGTASSYLLDTIFGLEVPPQGHLVRNVMLGTEMLQNHLRHFYAFCLPDYIRLPQNLPYQGEVVDRRFSRSENDRLVQHYLEAFGMAAKAHEAQTVFSGKAPHQHGSVGGGVTVAPAADRVMHAAALVEEIQAFIAAKMLPDTYLVAERYSDYRSIGTSEPRFIAFGLFRRETGAGTYWPAGLCQRGRCSPGISPGRIAEDVVSAWYEAEADASLAPDALPEPAPTKEQGYTFVKAVHYAGYPYECGPLARMAVAGEFAGVPNTMDRIVARSREAQQVADLVAQWLRQLEPGQPVRTEWEEPVISEAVSLTGAPRGALLHSAKVDGLRIERYGITTPTAWNFSPINRYGRRGPVEQALIGTEIRDLTQPVEVGRIVRAFDPCLSCATHLVRV